MLEQAAIFLKDLQGSLRLADLLDIGLISIILYWAMIWFKETASRSMVIGVSFIAGVYFLARAFSLHLTSILFQTVFAVLLIALVVVFQEDIRRLFEQIAAWGRIRERRRMNPSHLGIDTLVEAVGQLVSERTGALIVVQGQESLDRHLVGGVFLNGRISKPLLYSLFDPHSLGHDGALWISGGRVIQFAAHLPLSKNLREVGSLGTRHTAALGLSEVSDALIIAVSEERGTISVAEHGRLKKMDSAAELKNRLEIFYRKRFPPPQRADWTDWKEWLGQDIGIKIGALGLACLLWFMLAYQADTVQRTFFAPIEYRNVPKDWQVETFQPSEVRVTLAGSEREFDLFNPAGMVVSLDLIDVQEGGQWLSVAFKDINREEPLSVYQVEPRQVFLEARRWVTQELPVIVSAEGELSKELVLVGIQPVPLTLSVKMPASIEAQTKRIMTKPVNLSAVFQTTTLELDPILPESVRLQGKAPSKIRVTITVKKREFDG